MSFVNYKSAAAAALIAFASTNASAVLPSFLPWTTVVVDGKSPYEIYTGPTPEFGTILKGTSCKQKIWSPSPTQEAAEIAIKNQAAGAHYKILSCTTGGVSLQSNCFSTITCEAEIIGEEVSK
jgi:hypothetical protein